MGDKVRALAVALNAANDKFLEANKNPSRKVMEIDNRGSHFYLALYWAEAAAASSNAELKAQFEPIAKKLAAAEGTITQQLIDCQGKGQDVGGYYKFDDVKAFVAMRPSAAFNEIIDSM